VLSITNITAGHGGRYYNEDNYYLKSRSEWQGRGAAYLGLSGEVDGPDFINLLNGRNLDGEVLVRSGGRHRAGVDMTFSAPKGVSILYGVAGDERLREVHEKAVSLALGYAEADFSQARVTKDGVTRRVDTGNLVIATFGHDLSRELDPQLHTHAVVMNMTLRPDGRWRALANERLYANKMLLGQIYRNELGVGLSRLGYAVEVTDPGKGLIEVRGIEPGLVESFSQRSAQIEEKVKALKASGQYLNASEQKLREIATLGSRAAKRGVDMGSIVETWQERLREHGYDAEVIRDKALAQAEKDPPAGERGTDGLGAAIERLEASAPAWPGQEMLKHALKAGAGSLSLRHAEKRIEGLVKGRRLILLERNRYTTREAMRGELQRAEKEKEGTDMGQSVSAPQAGVRGPEAGTEMDEAKAHGTGEKELER